MNSDDRWYDLAEAQAEVVTRLGLDLLTTTTGYDQTARDQISRVLDLDGLLDQVIEPCHDDDGTPAWRITTSDDELVQLARDFEAPAPTNGPPHGAAPSPHDLVMGQPAARERITALDAAARLAIAEETPVVRDPKATH